MRRKQRPTLDLGGPHYRVAEIADALGVDPSTVLRWIHGGELEATRKGERGMFLVSQRALSAAGILVAGASSEANPEAALAPAGA